MTWGYRDGDSKKNPTHYPNYQLMQHRISDAYSRAARENNALLLPIGNIWSIIRRERPKLGEKLYYQDGRHPSHQGVFLISCIIFRSLFPSSLDFIQHQQLKNYFSADEIEYIKKTVTENVNMSRQLVDTSQNQKAVSRVFKHCVKKLEGSSQDFKKYERLASLNDVAIKYKLNKNQSLKELILIVQNQLDQLSGSGKHKREINSKKAFEAILKNERALFAQLAKTNAKKKLLKLSLIAKKFSKMAKMYPNTYYGLKAKGKSEDLLSMCEVEN